MAGEQKLGGKAFGGGGLVALALAALGLGVGLYRLIFGLKAVTNLSDQYPWGLWISFDVMAGVALAAGGFTTTLAAYVMGWKKYKPVVRPAVLTAFLGYLMVGVGLFFDVGKTDRFIVDTEWLGSMGAGVELNLGYAPVLRVNFTRATNFSTISRKTEFEFFIGYNY